MSTLPVDLTDRSAVLFQTTLARAAQSGKSTMVKVLAATRQSLQERVEQAHLQAERDHLELALKLLDHHASALCDQFPQALATAFHPSSPNGTNGSGVGALALQNLRLDQLELMDAAQVQESVGLARTQQSVMLSADAALAELNTYMAAMAGTSGFEPKRNPLRPEVYVGALKSLFGQMKVPSLVQMDWLQHMSDSLGQALSLLYKSLSQQLHSEGLVPMGDSIEHPQDRSTHVVLDQAQAVLTLDRLRSLLVGEFDLGTARLDVESFAEKFSREYGTGVETPPATEFAPTVPAALEALQEMKQVDRMLERIGQRRQDRVDERAAPALDEGSALAIRETLQQSASGLGQILSLEVVALMVENIAHDVRLLEPIRGIIQKLEPSLLRLAVVDPRFFSDKQHPARRLLQEITNRSLAFDAIDSLGFPHFLWSVERAVGPLIDMKIEGTEPFEQVLQVLIHAWNEQKKPLHVEKAMQALAHAEKRNLLAEKIARVIKSRPEAGRVPTGVLVFLCGPWAQVMAHARLTDQIGANDPGHYNELVAALLWSAQPALTSKNITKLTRLVPKLLGKLREGLDLIDYPPLKTSAFFELLMKLHQQAFKPPAIETPVNQHAELLPSLFEPEDPWVAPAEAKISGFIELPQEVRQHPAPALAPLLNLAESFPCVETNVSAADDDSLPVGTWVEMWVNGAWVRTQLSWASPHGTLFLFTSAYGSTQSMTRRSRDKQLAAGTMRVVVSQPVVEGALDAVVQTAMHNSLDVKL